MPRRDGRYMEARIYMAWAALALLLASWAGVAIHDQLGRREQGEQVAFPQSLSDETSGNPAQAVQPKPHTRTRGS